MIIIALWYYYMLAFVLEKRHNQRLPIQLDIGPVFDKNTTNDGSLRNHYCPIQLNT